MLLFFSLLGLHVSQLCGLMCIGVGDTFASVIGTQYGKHKWPGSKKSFEGTMAYIVSQLIGFFLLHLFSVFEMRTSFNFLTILLSIVLSAIVVGGLVLGKPILLYVDGNKKDGLALLFYTIFWLFVLLVLSFLMMAFV